MSLRCRFGIHRWVHEVIHLWGEPDVDVVVCSRCGQEEGR